MTDPITTTGAAANNPTPASPPPAAAPPATPPAAPQGAASRPGVITDAAYDALPAQDRDRFSRVRAGPDGGSIWQERATLASETNPAAGDTSATAPAVTAEGKLKIGSMELSEADITGLMERHALEQGRKAAMPATAGEYSLDLPSDFVMPEGQNFKWATDHPDVTRCWDHHRSRG
jgi:hypothetical protein